MKRRDAHHILIFSAAIAGAGAVWAMPAGMVETAVTASGVSSLIPAAAPPLGQTARLLAAGGAGLAAALVTAWISPWRANSRNPRDEGFLMSYIFSRLPFLSRRGQRPHALIEADTSSDRGPEDASITVRRSDAHPDAPPRPPVFASRDLGAEALPPVSEEDMPTFNDIYSGEFADDDPGMPRAPEPLPWEAIQKEMERLAAGMPAHSDAEAVGAAGNLSLHDLLERLERGLDRRRVTSPAKAGEGQDADTNAARPPRPAPNDGLQEALAALRSITAKAS